MEREEYLSEKARKDYEDIEKDKLKISLKDTSLYPIESRIRRAYLCPMCDKTLKFFTKRCRCGQKIDWRVVFV